jgi:hypothetical protein
VKLQLTDIWDVRLKRLLKLSLLQVDQKTVVELFTWEKLDFVDQVKRFWIVIRFSIKKKTSSIELVFY